jgi:hypothetical protein
MHKNIEKYPGKTVLLPSPFAKNEKNALAAWLNV